MKRLQQAKQLKLKVNRQLEQLGRKHLRDVRVVVKNMVYVVGMRMPGDLGHDEFLSLLRSNDYFGQYGKISKIYIRKPPHNPDNDNDDDEDLDVGIYISFVRREDAARAISALDGYQAPNNPGKTLQASYGSAKYCVSWLRGVKCEEGGVGGGCMGLHEWAAEADTFTRQDMATLQHTIKQTASGMMENAALQQQKERQRLALEQERLRQRATNGTGSGSGAQTPPMQTALAAAAAGTTTTAPARPGLPEPSDSNTALPGTARWAARPPPAPTPPAAAAAAAVPATPAAPPAKRRAKVLSLSNMGGKPTLTTLTPSGSSSSSSGAAAAAAAASPPAAAPTTATSTSTSSTPARKTTKSSETNDVAASSEHQPPTTTPAKTTKVKASSSSSLSRSNSTASSAAAAVAPPPGLTSLTTSSADPSAASSPETTHSVPQQSSKSVTAAAAEQRPSAAAAASSPPKAPATAATPTAAAVDEDDTTPSMPPLVPSSSTEQAAESLSPLPSPLPASPADQDMDGTAAVTTYQPSVQAQALLDEVILRREGLQPDFSVQSPYPDFDDLAESFADGDFSYVLDEKMVLGDEDAQSTYAVLMAQFIGPAVEDLLKKPRAEPTVTGGGAALGYDGGFDPFIEAKPLPSRDAMLLDENKRKGSRFGFANKTASDMMEKLTGGSLSGKITPMSSSSRPPQEPAEPSYFTNVPGSIPQPARSMTPSSVAMGSPAAAAARQRTISISSNNLGQQGQGGGANQMLPPPGLGSFPAYQNANALRSSSGMEQQMMSGMHSFQQQFQADGHGLRSQSPTINRTANVNAMNGNRFGGNDAPPTFPFQDPAIMAMRMAGAGGGGGPNPMFPPPPQGQPGFDGPFSQQQQQQQAAFQDGGMSARLLQQMHQGPQQQQQQQPPPPPPSMPPMNMGRASSPAQQMSNGGRSASRQSYHSGRWF